MDIIKKEANEKSSGKTSPQNADWNETSAVQKIVPGLLGAILLILIAGIGYWMVTSRTILIKSTRLNAEGGALVLINQTLLSPGDVIQKIQILEITGQGVVIESDGQKHALQIGESFNPLFTKLFPKKRITLRGTLFDENGDILAVLNKKLIPEGGKLKGVRVLKIDNHSIVIESGGVKRRLQVGESFNPDEK